MRESAAGKQRIFIEGPLPGFNSLIAASKSFGRRQGRRGRRYNRYAEQKKRWEERISLIVRAGGFGPLPERAWFDFVWYEPNRLRDPDNIAAAGRKLIFDAFVRAGIMAGDGWAHVAGWRDRFRLCGDGRPGVLVIVTPTGADPGPQRLSSDSVPRAYSRSEEGNVIGNRY